MELKLPVYLDNNATTVCDPRVVEAMVPYFTSHFGNASSSGHAYGWAAQEATDIAREQVARLINADSSEIIFTSGATESDNLAIKGVYEMYAAKGNHIITTVTEHKAVLETCRHLEKLGAEVSYLPVDSRGIIDLKELEKTIKATTVLIAIMYANNETGVIQPVKEIGAIAKRYGIIFFTDAAQAAGKVPIDVRVDGIDLMAISAHKMYGPKGAGVLYIRRRDPRVRLTPQMDGGGQERGIRSGTLNIPAIAGLGKACELCMDEMHVEAGRLAALRDRLETALLQIAGTRANGNGAHRLPHVTNLTFSHSLVTALQKELAISSGSACSSASPEPSYVLKAMGLTDNEAYNALRFGLGRFNTEEEIEYAIRRVNEAAALKNAMAKTLM